jgi:predicted translin family RNA/ssDNA-binding protein
MSDNLTTKELILTVKADLKEDISEIKTEVKEDIAKVEASLERVWEAIDKLKNRLPNWAVILISTLTALLGFFIKAD